MYKNIFKKLFIFLFLFFYKPAAKSFDSMSFICADEVGPILEFSVPEFNKTQKRTKISFKVYDPLDRKSFNMFKGIIEKKTSPIDTSYFFYSVISSSTNEEPYKINFQFFPPSHLLLQRKNSQFVDLVCWANEEKN